LLDKVELSKRDINIILTENYELKVISNPVADLDQHYLYLFNVTPSECCAALIMLRKLSVCKLRSNGFIHYVLYLISTLINVVVQEILFKNK
jgi:hypothetical protein